LTTKTCQWLKDGGVYSPNESIAGAGFGNIRPSDMLKRRIYGW
jgi:hypothetical protein